MDTRLRTFILAAVSLGTAGLVQAQEVPRWAVAAEGGVSDIHGRTEAEGGAAGAGGSAGSGAGGGLWNGSTAFVLDTAISHNHALGGDGADASDGGNGYAGGTASTIGKNGSNLYCGGGGGGGGAGVIRVYGVAPSSLGGAISPPAT